MDALQAIRTRRSIRVYQDKPVPEELVQQILTAAMYAPSAGDARPWQFVVITDCKLLRQIPTVHPHAPMAEQAPLAILVCGDAGMEKYPGNWPLDCAAAVENLLLAAHALGLGGVWTGCIPIKAAWRAWCGCLASPSTFWPTRSLSWVTPRSSRPTRSGTRQAASMSMACRPPKEHV